MGHDPDAAERIAALERQLEEAQAQNEQLMASLDTSERMVTVLEQSMDDVAAQVEDIQAEEEDKNPMARAFENMDMEKLAKAQGGAAVQMGYSKLFKQLQLDAATKDEVRQTLIAHSTEQLEEQFRLMGSEDESSQEERQQREEERKARLRDDLAQVLTRNQLEIYDNYDVDREMMASALDMQLGVYAGELTSENRELARDVLVDEMLAMQAELEATQTDDETVRIGSTANAGLDNQIRAMENAADRLADVLDPDQLSVFQDYIQQQMDMFESFRDIIEPSGEEGAENEEGARSRRVIVTVP